MSALRVAVNQRSAAGKNWPPPAFNLQKPRSLCPVRDWANRPDYDRLEAHCGLNRRGRKRTGSVGADRQVGACQFVAAKKRRRVPAKGTVVQLLGPQRRSHAVLAPLHHQLGAGLRCTAPQMAKADHLAVEGDHATLMACRTSLPLDVLRTGVLRFRGPAIDSLILIDAEPSKPATVADVSKCAATSPCRRNCPFAKCAAKEHVVI